MSDRTKDILKYAVAALKILVICNGVFNWLPLDYLNQILAILAGVGLFVMPPTTHLQTLHEAMGTAPPVNPATIPVKPPKGRWQQGGRFCLAIGFVLALWGVGEPAMAQTGRPAVREERGTVTDATVRLFLPDDPAVPRNPQAQQGLGSCGSGTCFLWKDGTGWVLTCKHVVAIHQPIMVQFPDRRTFLGKLVAEDPREDLALVSFESKEPATWTGVASQDVQRGNPVWLVGYPAGKGPKVKNGTAGGGSGSDLVLSFYPESGDSGGGVFGGDGLLVGVLWGHLLDHNRPTGGGRATGLTEVRRFLAEY